MDLSLPLPSLFFSLSFFLFFFSLHPDEIYGNVCAYNERRATGIVTTARNLMRIGSIRRIYPRARTRARTPRFINKMNTPISLSFSHLLSPFLPSHLTLLTSPSRLRTTRHPRLKYERNVRARVARCIISNGINFARNNKSSGSTGRKLLFKKIEPRTEIPSTNSCG